MATAYTPILKLALPVTGELNGTWGDVVNQNITSMVEQAVAGLATINTWTANSHTLTTANGTTSESRCAMLVIDDDGAGNPSAAATVICPNATKPYIVQNLCGQTVTVKTAAGTGVAIPNNQSALVFCNGTNVVTGAFNGDVVGPASATDNAIVRYDGATGKLIQNSSVTIDDSNNISGVVQLNATTLDATNLEVTNLKAKDGTSAGSIADSTGIVTLASTVLTTTDINGGTVDNATIGATTASTVRATQVDIIAQGDLRLQDTTGGEFVALQAPGTLASSYTLTLPVDDGTSGQALITDGSGVLSWSTAASGDVYGPASATDNAIARFDGTTGKIIQNSAVTIADTTGNMAGVGTLGVGAITTTGALTYGGVTLNNAVTGTGNMVLSTSPTLVTPALGTPASGVVTNLTGTASININGTVGATTPNTGAFTTLSSSGNTTLGDATADLITANGRFNTDLVPSTDNARDLGTAALEWKQVYAATFTENGSPAVVQTDIGTAPNEIPLNQYLGSMAYQDRTAVNIGGGVATLGTATITSIQNDTEISNVEPSLMLNFAAVEALDPRITYSRASTATYYNGVTTAVAEQNLALQSETFDTASWTKSNSTITANATTAPDGNTTADALFETATTSSHLITQSITGVIVADYIASVYAKVGNRNFLSIGFDGLNAWFNLSTGAVATVEAGLTGSIVSVGSGWYRCSVKRTVATAATKTFAIYSSTADNVVSYAGDAASAAIFIWGAQLEQRSAVSAYTPTTTQPITNYTPVLLTAASGVPRFDHNPISQESLGFLVEEQRTNLVTYSADLSNAAWTKTNTTITADTIVAPDGTLTGDKLVETTATGAHTANQTSTVINNASYTISVYAKASERNWLYIQEDSGGGNYAFFNLSTGVTGTVNAGTATITSVGNGWYRCTLTHTQTIGTAERVRIGVSNANFTFSYAGDGYSGIYIWGAQLETGAFATSYIATVASQVTRSADVATMTGTNFSSWFNINEGTVYVDTNTVDNTDSRVFVLSGAPNPRLIDLYAIASPNRYVAFVNNSSQTDISDTFAIGAAKIAISYGSTGTVSTQNGSTPRTGITVSTAVIAAQITQLNIGSWNNASQLNGTIKKLSYFPRRLSDAELQEMTS